MRSVFVLYFVVRHNEKDMKNFKNKIPMQFMNENDIKVN